MIDWFAFYLLTRGYPSDEKTESSDVLCPEFWANIDKQDKKQKSP